jgi:hypothetical protein
MIPATLVVATTLWWATPAFAQNDVEPEPTGVTILDDGEDAQPESGILRDDDTSATVRDIRRDLVTVAVVTAAGLIVYVWHTSPSRRVRIAARRAEVVLDGVDDD